jgi:hypothetical protein
MVTRDPGPDDVVALKDRVARAADFVAQLTDLEREVVAVMAIRGAGAAVAYLVAFSARAARVAQQSRPSRRVGSNG